MCLRGYIFNGFRKKGNNEECLIWIVFSEYCSASEIEKKKIGAVKVNGFGVRLTLSYCEYDQK